MGKIITKDIFVEKSKEKHDNFYKYDNFIYKNALHKSFVTCPIHEDFLVSPNNHSNNGSGCPSCKKDKISKAKISSIEEVIEKFIKTHGDKYDYSKFKKYLGMHVKIEIICNSCKTSFFCTPDKHINKRGCRNCSIQIRVLNSRKSNEEFLIQCNSIHGNEYEYLEKYIKSDYPIKIKHKFCGNIFRQRPNKHLSGQGCPICSESYGEKRIRIFLSDSFYKFESEFRFKNCRYKLPLPFDFCVYKEDGSIWFLIEFQGRQHYHIEYWKKYGLSKEECEKALEKQKINDNIKIKYCTENNINLLQISYKDFNRIEYMINRYMIEGN